jgi:nanoRNase/pAp phosphatase (c-di-AMP/oligoRNAs hydrolase)
MGAVGPVLFEKQLAAACKSLDESHQFRTSKGTRVCMFQGVSTTSDAAEIDEQQHVMLGRGERYPTELVVGFHYRVDAGKLQLQFSMRSHTGYDVSAFAKAHGGGGHKAAAGFTVEVSPETGANPYRVFQLLLEAYEDD